MEHEMTAKETSRMSSYLRKKKGMTADEILELIDFIATGILPDDSEADKKADNETEDS